MSEALYTSCAEVLSICQATEDDLAALLHPETGFAPRLRQLCQEQLAELENSPSEEVSVAEIEALKMESDTWALLQALMPLRKTTPPAYPTPRTLLSANPYTPPATLVQSIMHTSSLLSALVVVREWLHDTFSLSSTSGAPDPGPTTGYWRFTKHVIMQGRRTGKVAPGVVQEMDPDAVNRNGTGNGSGAGGRTLAIDDASYEKALVQALFALVRAGRLEEAVALCRRAQQPWRAASINGALLLRWRAIAHEPREDDEDPADDEMNVDGDATEEGWRGNLRRKLWKTACTRAALNQALSPTERALYAALAPSPQTAVPLKASCRTWEDQLWALVCIACEEKLSAGLSSLAGMSFWEGGAVAVEAGEGLAGVDQEGEGDAEGDWEREVVAALESLSSVSVEDGPPADNPYHVTQLHVILDRTDELFDAFAEGLRTHAYDPASPEYPTMTRFFAHLCLYLKLIDVPVSALAMQVILEAYLQVLEAAGQRDLIAMYAGALGDNAVERYAMFLTSLDLSVDAHERRLALTRAREHGLDMHRVAIATAERTIEKAFTLLPPAKGPLPSVIGMQLPPSDPELFLLRSIEWTTFMESTYPTALEQANVILRYFLGCGRVQLAKMLLDVLPADLGAFRQPEDLATEFLHYRQFFVSWESLARVVECQALETPQMNKDSRLAWLEDYKILLQQAREQIVKLLTTEWLVLESNASGGEARHQQLRRIRQIYVPELIIRLHALLVASRAKIPENLKHAILLVNVVADSRYQLTNDFVSQEGRRLGDYLSAVRQAILAGLEGGGSNPFRIITL